MPGKSRQRNVATSKKRRDKRRSSTIAATQREVLQRRAPVAHSREVAPTAEIKTPKATATTVRYPYIAAELRRTGILGGIMLAILVVLALVLS